MKNFKKIAALVLLICLVAVPFGSAVYGDEPTETAAESQYDGEYISEYVEQIVEYLALFAKEGVTRDSLYESALLEVLKQHPELYETVMNALLSSIDEHSVYYKSGEFQQFISQLEGAVGGIGITFNEVGDTLVVGSVYEDSPAAKAGVLPGDILYSADGNSLIGIALSAAQNYIRGEVGTQVVVGVLREGYTEPLYFTIIREEIGEKLSVYHTVYEGVDQSDPTKTRQLMYIRIYTFMDNSAAQFKEAIDEADSKGITDIVIDVRDNGGGYLGAAAEIANFFVPEGNVIVTEDHKLDMMDVVYKSDNKRTAENDVVVLVNENSASASEILAAAIQENGVGVVIGTRTYGKGTVQSSVSLKDDEAMKFTVAYYLTPSGNNIDKIGVTPDAVVENGSEPFDYSSYEDFDYTAVYQRGISDPNVAKAKAIFAVWGWYTGDVTNPYFDGELEAAITEYQAYNDLFPYGVLDLTTQRQLYKDLTETTVEIDNQFDAALSHFGITLAENN